LGFEIEGLLKVVKDGPHGENSRVTFIKQLEERANFISTQRGDIINPWGPHSDIQIFSFYETKSAQDSVKVRTLSIPHLPDRRALIMLGITPCLHIISTRKIKTPGLNVTICIIRMLTSAQLSRGEYTEDKNTVITVKKDTALLFLPYEDQIPVGRAHTDLVKFSSKSDATYQTLVRHICQCRDNIGKYIPIILSESENCLELYSDTD
jgi:hypothetical protein